MSPDYSPITVQRMVNIERKVARLGRRVEAIERFANLHPTSPPDPGEWEVTMATRTLEKMGHATLGEAILAEDARLKEQREEQREAEAMLRAARAALPPDDFEKEEL